MSETIIYLHQALFGYREGHRLLQASRPFTPATERVLLTLTDISGPRMVNGFEEYICGYPLPGEESYALTKTWYAPEMERPGCVWSHVLLIRIEDIAEIGHASELKALFKHPSKTDLKQYVAPVKVHRDSIFQRVPQVFVGHNRDDAEILLQLLYDQPAKSVIIPAKNSLRPYEDLILAVWSQQWPALRLAFRFCTGSLSNRTMGGKPFDLQVVPFSLLHELQRSPQVFEFLNSENRQWRIADAEHWSRSGARDLEEGEDGAFRQFLWNYADPCAGQRSLYKKMSLLFADLEQAISTSVDISKVTELVASIFSEKTCGTAIKQYLYGSGANTESYPPFNSEIRRLTELATTPFWSSFDASQLDLRLRARNLWEAQPTMARDLLFKILHNPSQELSGEILAGFVKAMNPSEVCELGQANSVLVSTLVSRNPHIVISDKFWHCPFSSQTYDNIFNFLRTSEATEKVPPKTWIQSVLKGGADWFAFPIVERFGNEAVDACFERVETLVEANWIPPAEWCSALSNNQDLLVNFLKDPTKRSSRAMALLAGLLDPHGSALIAFGLSPWVALTSEAPELIRDFPRAEAAAFLLSLGFQHSNSEAIELLVVSFETVHSAAANDTLSFRGWKILEDELPTLSWWMKVWDRCERLREGLLERFIRYQWPQQAFLQCVSKRETILRMFSSCREVRGGEHFMRSVAENVFSGALNTTKEQGEIFHESFRRNWNGDIVLNI